MRSVGYRTEKDLPKAVEVQSDALETQAEKELAIDSSRDKSERRDGCLTQAISFLSLNSPWRRQLWRLCFPPLLTVWYLLGGAFSVPDCMGVGRTCFCVLSSATEAVSSASFLLAQALSRA